MENNLETELKSIEKAIRNGEVEKGVRQSQLDALMPKRLKLEAQSQSDYGVSITDLQDTLDLLKEKLAVDVAALSAEVLAIQNNVE